MEETPLLRRQTNWEELYFYQKANSLYQMTFAFAKRFLKKGDRTITKWCKLLDLANKTSWKVQLMA